MDENVYILSGCRTAIGSFMGQYSNVSAVTLGATVIQEATKRARVSRDDVSEVIMGHVLTTGCGQNPARQSALAAGIPQEVTSSTLNMLCGSGLKSVYNAYNAVKAKESSIIICGGMENMSLAKHCISDRTGKRLGNLVIEDTILLDGLTDAVTKLHMGKTAEHLARTYKVSRSEQDEFALKSQKKAQNAIENDYFKDEIVAVRDCEGRIIDKDEHVRFNSTIEELLKLKPAFESDGTVTAGNASGINDGAAALVVCSGTILKEKDVIPLARIVGFAQSGLDPIEMGLGPIKAIKKLLETIKWSLDQVDIFEINEAFAVQSLLVIKALNIDENKVNITGGAIALGHPIGASGARVLVTLLHNMIRTKKSKGVASLCIGGGMGIAVAVQID